MSLQLRLPIRNRTAEADLGTALLNKRTGLYQFRQVQQVIREDVRDALHRLEESKLTIAASATALDLARKTLAAEQRKYELGAQTIFFVLDAQNTVEQSEQSYVQAQINYQLAIAAFDRSTGNLLDRNRVLIQGAVH
jgi:HAE1 family hydrophobic/amphiphilic exporter-1